MFFLNHVSSRDCSLYSASNDLNSHSLQWEILLYLTINYFILCGSVALYYNILMFLRDTNGPWKNITTSPCVRHVFFMSKGGGGRGRWRQILRLISISATYVTRHLLATDQKIYVAYKPTCLFFVQITAFISYTEQWVTLRKETMKGG